MAAAGRTLIDDDLAAFLRGPVSAFLGTSDSMATPDGTRIVGVTPTDGTHLRVLIPERALTSRRNAVPGAQVAVLVTDITTYRSVQWKGRVAGGAEARSPGDTVLIDQHVRRFASAGHAVGIDPAHAWKFFATDAIPLIIEVDQVFDQTPGPRAGNELLTVDDPPTH